MRVIVVDETDNIDNVNKAIKGSKLDITTLLCYKEGKSVKDWATNNNVPIDEYQAEWRNLTTNKPKKIEYDNTGRTINVLAGKNRNTDMCHNADCMILIFKERLSNTRDLIKKSSAFNLKLFELKT